MIRRRFLFGNKKNNPIPALVSAYQERVLADGGNVDETQANLVNLLNQLNGVVPDFTNSCKLFVAPHLGNKRASGTGATAGNRAANKLYNIFGSSGDLIQATAANQPLVLVHTGVNYIYNSGEIGNNFTASGSKAFSGDITVTFKVNINQWSSAARIIGIEQSHNVQNNFRVLLDNGLVRYFYGATTITSSSVVPFSLNEDFHVKITQIVNNGAGGNDVIFYTSTDGVNWTQLGTTVTTAGVVSRTLNVNQLVYIGSTTTASRYILYNAAIYNNTTGTGTPIYLFDPNNYNRANSQTSWTSTTGEVWTLSTAATNTALKAAIVDQTMLMGNGTSYGMQAPGFNLTGSAFTRYTIFQKYSNTAGFQIINELGANIASIQGLYLAINSSASNEEFGVKAGGLNNSRYTSNSLLMKVATNVVNINNADEATPYLIDNSAQSLVAKDSSFNNTSPVNATGLNLLARNNAASLWANATIFADLIFEGEHDATTRTSVYNILKTYFNL